MTVKIKKYANRRLYDTDKSTYITLAELAKMVQSGRSVEVRDARSDEDLTRITLVQVILEIETEGHQMLPIGALQQIIMAHGGENKALFSRYLERTMMAFTRHQDTAQAMLNKSLDVIMDSTLKPDFDVLAPDTPTPDMPAESYESLRDELDALRAKLDHISSRKTD